MYSIMEYIKYGILYFFIPLIGSYWVVDTGAAGGGDCGLVIFRVIRPDKKVIRNRKPIANWASYL